MKQLCEWQDFMEVSSTGTFRKTRAQATRRTSQNSAGRRITTPALTIDSAGAGVQQIDHPVHVVSGFPDISVSLSVAGTDMSVLHFFAGNGISGIISTEILSTEILRLRNP
jgi:hypothetical protein